LVITPLPSRFDHYLLYQIKQWNGHLKSNNKKVISNKDIIFILLLKIASITIKFIYKAVNFSLKQNFGKFLIELEFFLHFREQCFLIFKKMAKFKIFIILNVALKLFLKKNTTKIKVTIISHFLIFKKKTLEYVHS
jgi:hypothetical protein